MKILGKGHKGVVVATAADVVEKYYISRSEWQKEKTQLTFLAKIQRRGFDLGIMIPKLRDSAEGKWEIASQVYGYRNTMERLPGITAARGITDKNVSTVGANLGKLLFTLHTASKEYQLGWTAQFGTSDNLYKHIADEKVAAIIQDEPDQHVVQQTRGAASYLAREVPEVRSTYALSHLDLNLNNILISTDGSITGLVDWGDFGITNPSLSLYQLATEPDLWPYIQTHYEAAGGTIDLGIVYAAATIHLAWAPVICKKLALPLAPHESQKHFQMMYENFTTSAKSNLI